MKVYEGTWENVLLNSDNNYKKWFLIDNPSFSIEQELLSLEFVRVDESVIVIVNESRWRGRQIPLLAIRYLYGHLGVHPIFDGPLLVILWAYSVYFPFGISRLDYDVWVWNVGRIVSPLRAYFLPHNDSARIWTGVSTLTAYAALGESVLDQTRPHRLEYLLTLEIVKSSSRLFNSIEGNANDNVSAHHNCFCVEAPCFDLLCFVYHSNTITLLFIKVSIEVCNCVVITPPGPTQVPS